MADQSAFSVILWTTDIGGLARFLTAVTGAELWEQHPGYAALRVGTTLLELHADEAYRGHPWFDALKHEGAARGIGTELRFEVQDVHAAYIRALSNAARAITPPYDSGDTFECQVMGPDGFLLCLWSRR